MKMSIQILIFFFINKNTFRRDHRHMVGKNEHFYWHMCAVKFQKLQIQTFTIEKRPSSLWCAHAWKHIKCAFNQLINTINSYTIARKEEKNWINFWCVWTWLPIGIQKTKFAKKKTHFTLLLTHSFIILISYRVYWNTQHFSISKPFKWFR